MTYDYFISETGYVITVDGVPIGNVSFELIHLEKLLACANEYIEEYETEIEKLYAEKRNLQTLNEKLTGLVQAAMTAKDITPELRSAMLAALQ